MPVKWGKVVQGELGATPDNPPSHTEDGAPGKSTARSGRQETLDRAPCGVRPALSKAEGCLGTAVWRARLASPTASRQAKTRYSGDLSRRKERQHRRQDAGATRTSRRMAEASPSKLAGHDISCPYEEIRLAASRSAGILPANFWGVIKNQNRRRDGGATRTSRRMGGEAPRMRAPSLTALRARKPCPSTQENNAGETPALRKSAGGFNGARLT